MVQLAAVADVATGDTAQADARAETTLELLDFEVIAYNSFGGTVDPPDLTVLAAVPQADGKSFMMNLAGFTPPDADQPLDADDITRVLIFIPKHAFEVADPRANLDAGVRTVDGKSAEASLTINYVRADGTGANPRRE